MPDLRLIALTALHVIWWPISHTVRAAVLVLTPIWTLLAFILLPPVHLAQATFSIVTFPFRGKWLHRIETLYIYLGTAGLIGCITGAVVYVLFKLISTSLPGHSYPSPRDRGRTVADFRVEQRRKEPRVKKKKPPAEVPVPATPIILKPVPGARRQGLLSQAIIEEEDSDF